MEDDDVEEERKRMTQTANAEMTLAVHDLNKYYGSYHAVRDLTFGIEPDECFGLLG